MDTKTTTAAPCCTCCDADATCCGPGGCCTLGTCDSTCACTCGINK